MAINKFKLVVSQNKDVFTVDFEYCDNKGNLTVIVIASSEDKNHK